VQETPTAAATTTTTTTLFAGLSTPYTLVLACTETTSNEGKLPHKCGSALRMRTLLTFVLSAVHLDC
jgi:hypothetical protein